ncbi:hypothetical protein PALB_6400 [Pseudoalteromonas luteoviolacea B = ATCC 29581]|nr:hypothetical protein PALB_6400 [Pseudoalteromonas luteoviolacea B = ATCC 29581]
MNLGIHTTDSKFAGLRTQVSQDHATFEGDIDLRQLSSFGLQAEWQFSNEIQFVSQLLLKDTANNSILDKVKMAFLRYTPAPEYMLSVGRMSLDLYMMTDYRDIGFAYVPTNLPVEFYGIIPHESLDGIEFTYKKNSDRGLLSVKGFYGQSDSPVVSDDNFIWDVKLRNMAGLTLSWEANDWLIRAHHSITKAKDGYPGQNELVTALRLIPVSVWPSIEAVRESLLFENAKLTYTTIGTRFDNGEYILRSELSWVDSKSILLNDLLTGYASIGKRFADHALMLTYSHIEADAPNIAPPLISTPELNFLYAAVKQATDFYRLRQDTYSLSWRYDMSDSWALKAQYNYTSIQYQPSGLYLHDFGNNSDDAFSSISLSSHWIFDL